MFWPLPCYEMVISSLGLALRLHSLVLPGMGRLVYLVPSWPCLGSTCPTLGEGGEAHVRDRQASVQRW